MEEFKKIDGYDNYEISNLGNVRNTDTNRILKPHNDKDGYYCVILCKDGTRKTSRIHRLICLYFVPNPENFPCIDHIDRSKTNNSISNLRWISRSNNNRSKPKKQNTSSKYMGAHFHKRRGKYQAYISINNKRKHIGCYETEDEAGRAFDTYIKEHNLSEFYNLNFPDSVVLS